MCRVCTGAALGAPTRPLRTRVWGPQAGGNHECGRSSVSEERRSPGSGREAEICVRRRHRQQHAPDDPTYKWVTDPSGRCFEEDTRTANTARRGHPTSLIAWETRTETRGDAPDTPQGGGRGAGPGGGGRGAVMPCWGGREPVPRRLHGGAVGPSKPPAASRTAAGRQRPPRGPRQEGDAGWPIHTLGRHSALNEQRRGRTLPWVKWAINRGQGLSDPPSLRSQRSQIRRDGG